MKGNTAWKIATVCTSEEIQRWSSGIGRFVQEQHPSVVETARKVCDCCPFRCKGSLGGCIGEDCPMQAVRQAVNRACARATNGVKEIYRAKYSRGAA